MSLLKSKNTFPIVLKDDFLFFTWNNINSKDYNCFIENKNDLSFSPHPSFSNNFETPLYQNTRYLLGTTTEGKELELNLCFYNITLEDFNYILSTWLKPGLTSLFQYDYEPWYGYNCRLKSIGNAKKYILDKTNGYNYLIEVSISLETITDSYALCKYFTVYEDRVNYSGWFYDSDDPNGSKLQINELTPATINSVNNNISNSLEIQPNKWYTDTSSTSDNAFKWHNTCSDSYVIRSYQINNLGSLDAPFQISIDNLPAGGICKIFNTIGGDFNDYYTEIKNTQATDFKDSNAIAWFETNKEINDSTLKYTYDSNTGLITIANQPANMTILKGIQPLLFNRCLANQSFPVGISYLWVFINTYVKDTFDASNITINISFRKRQAVI
jgi:hypothetical protein